MAAAKDVVLRERASTDVRSIVEHYRAEGGDALALRFVDSLESAVEHLGRHPLTPSLRFAYDLEIPDLRSWPLRSFPYLIFYVDTDTRVDVWRILHARRDVPAWFHGPDEQP